MRSLLPPLPLSLRPARWMSATLALFAGHAVAEPIKLPVAEAPEAWEQAFALTGLVPGDPGSGPGVTVIPNGSAWLLRVRDDSGSVHEVVVAPPESPGAREDVAWLAASLLHSTGVPPASQLPPVQLASVTIPAPPRAVPAPVRPAQRGSPAPPQPPSPARAAPSSSPPPSTLPPPLVVPPAPTVAATVATALAAEVPVVGPASASLAPALPPDPPTASSSLAPPSSPALSAALSPAEPLLLDPPATAPGTTPARQAWASVGTGIGVRPGVSPALGLWADAGVQVGGPLLVGLGWESRLPASIVTIAGDQRMSTHQAELLVGARGGAIPLSGLIVAGVARHAFLEGAEALSPVMTPVIGVDLGLGLPVGRNTTVDATCRIAVDTRGIDLFLGEAEPTALARWTGRCGVRLRPAIALTANRSAR